MDDNGAAEEKYLQAGKIASQAVRFAQGLVRPGISLLELASSIEGEIRKLGGGIAFPVNLSLNNAAAHDTPAVGDERVLGEADIVKVDLGVHVGGYIADCAFSYSADPKKEKLIEASRAALDAAIKKIGPGVAAREVGEAISSEITSRGFVPVANLCGHSLAQYAIHAGAEVPNVARGSHVFSEGDVFAVEPFASTGSGFVNETNECQIYSLAGKNARLAQSRRVLEFAQENFGRLPFAKRFLSGAGLMDANMLELALRDLARNRCLEAYPVLAEKPGVMISQRETTVIVTGDGARSTVEAIA